jgi:hypothetical protein
MVIYHSILTLEIVGLKLPVLFYNIGPDGRMVPGYVFFFL